ASDCLTLSRNLSGDRRARQQKLDRLLASNPRRDARQSLFLFERRANGGRRAPRALRVPSDLLLDLIRTCVGLLLPRELVEIERARCAFRRGVALALAERLPVDARLAGVDALIHHPPREILEAAIELSLDERCRHLESQTLGNLLHQLAAQLAL